MQITRHNSNVHQSKLPAMQSQPADHAHDRYEPAPATPPLWKRCLTAGLATGAGAGVFSSVGAFMGPANPAGPLLTGGLMGGLGCAAGASQGGTAEGVFGGMVMGSMAAIATVPGMLYGYQGALMAVGGGAVCGVLSVIMTELDKG